MVQLINIHEAIPLWLSQVDKQCHKCLIINAGLIHFRLHQRALYAKAHTGTIQQLLACVELLYRPFQQCHAFNCRVDGKPTTDPIHPAYWTTGTNWCHPPSQGTPCTGNCYTATTLCMLDTHGHHAWHNPRTLPQSWCRRVQMPSTTGPEMAFQMPGRMACIR